MPQSKSIANFLWCCLCPRFRHFALQFLLISPIVRRKPPFHRLQTGFIASTLVRRCYSTILDENGDSDKANTKLCTGSIGGLSHAGSVAARGDNQHDNTPKPKFLRRIVERPPGKTFGVPHNLQGRSTSDLEAMLQDLMAKPPSMMAVTAILRILIRDRHVRPEVRHYKALILANTDGKHGSPDNIRRLLKEMEDNSIPLDSGTLHAALQVLAIHPDYLLRQDILRILRDRWLSLSPSGWHHLVAGLIREHQFEMAIDHMTHMERKGIHVESWLHSLLVYNLCDVEEFDQVLELMKSRSNQEHDMTMNLWLYVLDVASEAIHYKTTSYVWKQAVEPGSVNPSHGVCCNVLTVASRVGDPDLAVSVCHFLTKTEVPLSPEDYEKLAEAYVVSGNLHGAFKALCLMKKAGIPLEESSTRSILTYMMRAKMEPQDAWVMLKQLKASGEDIPINCANVVIELCGHATSNNDNVSVVDKAIGFYKELYALCPRGADVTTYNSLIGICRRAKHAEACMFVVKEMAALGIMPNAVTFGSLILMCLDSGNFRSGYMYFQDLLERDWTLNDSTCAEIRRICRGLDDEFAVRLGLHPLVRAGVPIRRGAAFPRMGRVPVSQKQKQFRLSQGVWQGKWVQRRREIRRMASKERRKRKRRLAAIARGMEEEGWLDWEASNLSSPSESKDPEPGPKTS